MMRGPAFRLVVFGLAAFVGCADPAPEPVSQPPKRHEAAGVYLAPSAQKPGDPALGLELMLSKGYVGCGIPASAFPLLRRLTPATFDEVWPGRTGPAADFPYSWNLHTTDEGVDLAVPNCLLCHAGHLNGELVMGLGNVESDFTVDFSIVSKAVDFLTPVADLMFTAGEQAELAKFAGRVAVLERITRMRTVGSNPANEIGVQIFRHRDRETLAWSDEPLIGLPAEERIPLDVPPWWHMRHKSTMFYNGMGRGDHRQTMMTASSLCVDDVADALEIDTYFHHIAAYIASIEPPRWPWPIDGAQAAHGKRVFEANCAGCHGRYGDDGTVDYPNLRIPLGVIGTDPIYVYGGSILGEFVDWYNSSVYGREAWLEPGDGYVAPPLAGVWASAPYFHNGSVPTVAHVLDSRSRPAYWKRLDYDSRNYDRRRLGWPIVELDYGQDAADDDERRFIYDTTQLGHWNRGHTFGDHLTPVERRAVVEYLKTL